MSAIPRENHRGKRARSVSLEERLWTSISPEPNSGCWLWLGTHHKFGYGLMSYRGRTRPAHRLAFEVYNGPIASGLWVLHKCDNPACCNPRHLFLGTCADNERDKCAKGRQARGERQHLAVLTAEMATAIREQYIEEHSSLAHFSNAFEVCQTSISNVITGRTWKHLDPTLIAMSKVARHLRFKRYSQARSVIDELAREVGQ